MKERGVVYGVLAYTAWGLLPLYWQRLNSVPPVEVLMHRVVWSLVFVLAVLSYLGQMAEFSRTVLNDRRSVLLYIASALLLSVNWGVFIWSVQRGHVLEASLGYFICPLVIVLSGLVVFSESLRPLQWCSVVLAGGAVAYLTVTLGKPPWIALALAVSFAAYGTLRKVSVLNSLQGLAAETAVMSVPALALIGYWECTGTGHFLDSPGISALLAGAGIITALPLLCFASAARRVSFALLGMLQYIGPTLQFLLGVYWFQEPVSFEKLIAFIVIWCAISLFVFDQSRRLGSQQSVESIEAPGRAAA